MDDPWARFPDADPWAAFPDAPMQAGPAAPAQAGPVAPSVSGTAAEIAARAEAQPPLRDDRGFGQNMLGLGIATVDGVREGVATLLGAPVDLVNNAPRLANLIPGVDGVGPMSDAPFGGRATADSVLRLFGLVPDYEPQNGAERIANRVGQELGAMAVPVGGAIGASNRGIAAISRAVGDQALTSPVNIFAQRALTASQKPITTAVGRKAGGSLASMFNLPAQPLATAGGAVDDFVNAAAMGARNVYLDSLRAAAVNPVGLAGREALFAGGAGAGAGVATEFFGDDPLVDMGGSVAGALGTSAAGGLVGALRNVAAGATGNAGFADDVANAAVAERIINSSAQMQDQAARLANAGLPPNSLSTDNLVVRLRAESAAEKAVPGFRANIADRTQDPGLATLAYNTDTLSPGAAAARRTGNEAAINERMTGLAPEGDAGRFRSDLQSGVDARIATAQDAQATQQAAFDDITQALQPVMREASARGSSVRSALADAYSGAQEQVRGLYGRVDSDGTLVDPSDLVARTVARDANMAPNDAKRFRPAEADTILEMTPGERAPLRDTGLVNEFNRPIYAENGFNGPVADANGLPAVQGETAGRPATTVPLSDISAIRSGLTDDLRAAQRAGSTQQARILKQRIEDIDGYMDETLPPDLRAALDEARTARRDVGERFERPGTALEQILAERGGGGYALNDSAVAGRFTPTDQGKLSDLKSALAEAGGDARLRDGLADELRAQVVKNGLLDNPKALGKYMAERQVLLSEFPELRTQLENAGATRANLAAAEKVAKQVTFDLTTPGRSAEASYLRQVEDPAAAIRTVTSSPDPRKAVADLVATANSPQAKADLRTALWEEVERTGKLEADGMTGETRWNGKKLRAMFENPKFAAVAEELWADDPQDLADIKNVFNALAGVEGSTRARAPGSSGTAQALSGALDPAMTASSIASRARSVSRGQLSPTIAAVDILGTWLRRRSAQVQSRSIDAIAASVVNNPGLAADLMEKHNPATAAARRAMITQKYGVRATTLLNILEEAENEDPVIDAVTGEQ